MFRFNVSVATGTTLTVNVDTCGANTNFGTYLALFESCPDPWAALTQSDYLTNHAISVNDDDDSCVSGAMTSSGVSRASKVTADIDDTITELYALVLVDNSTDVVGYSNSISKAFQIGVKCGLTTPTPTAAPTQLPTQSPTYDYVTRLQLNASIRLEYAVPDDFDWSRAGEAFGAAFAEVREREMMILVDVSLMSLYIVVC